MWDCPLCQEKRDAIRLTRFSSLPNVLIIHIKRFTNILPSQFFKNSIDVSCTSPLSIFEHVDDSAYVKRTYNLRAIVHHSGTLDNGHYTASVFDKKQNKWFKCNDKAVVPETTKTNKKTPYVLFYVQNWYFLLSTRRNVSSCWFINLDHLHLESRLFKIFI